jgi:copper resistance protein D
MLTALLIITRAAHIAASISIAGIFTFELVTLGLAGPSMSDDFHQVDRRLFRLAVWTLVVALVSALLWLWLEVANMSGLGLADAFSRTAWGTVLFGTEFGRVWQLRFGLIAVAFALIASGLVRGEVRRPLLLILWLLGVAFLVSLAWINHAAAASVQPLGLFGDVLHLCAAGGWIGGLAPLAIFLTRLHTSFSLGEGAAVVLRRFSTLSLCCVSVLIVSGISNSCLLVGSIHALFTTLYGRLLVIKLTLFAILIGFGVRNRFMVKTNLRSVPPVSDLLPQLRRNVICEACLGAAVVVIVACLGVTPPSAPSMMNKNQTSRGIFRSPMTR